MRSNASPAPSESGVRLSVPGHAPTRDAVEAELIFDDCWPTSVSDLGYDAG